MGRIVPSKGMNWQSAASALADALFTPVQRGVPIVWPAGATIPKRQVDPAGSFGHRRGAALPRLFVLGTEHELS